MSLVQSNNGRGAGLPNPEWYLIRTLPRSDRLAADELAGSGFEVYFPRLTKIHAVKGVTDEPLFPGYIFLRWDKRDSGLPSLRGLPHVAGWVSFGGVTPTVPDSEVTELASWTEDVNLKGGNWRRFEPGEEVRVVSGQLNCLAKVLEGSKSPRARARVLLNFMGRRVRAEVPWESLSPIEDGSGKQARPPRRTRGKGRWIRGFSSPELGRA